MFEPTGSQRDAARTIFNLSDYRALDALEAERHLAQEALRDRRVDIAVLHAE